MTESEKDDSEESPDADETQEPKVPEPVVQKPVKSRISRKRARIVNKEDGYVLQVVGV